MKTKFKILIICVLVHLLMIASTALLFAESGTPSNTIQVQSLGSLDLGNILKGSVVTPIVDNILTFVITSQSPANVRIIKYASEHSQGGCIITTSWRMGPVSGFEYPYSMNIVYLTNNIYFVTMKVVEIYAPLSISSGQHTFNQTVYVELCNL